MCDHEHMPAKALVLSFPPIVGYPCIAPTLCEIPIHMSTKRAALRKGKSSNTRTVPKGKNSRASRKTATAKRLALAATGEAASKKAAAPTKAKVKAAPAKAPAGKAKPGPAKK